MLVYSSCPKEHNHHSQKKSRKKSCYQRGLNIFHDKLREGSWSFHNQHGDRGPLGPHDTRKANQTQTEPNLHP